MFQSSQATFVLSAKERTATTWTNRIILCSEKWKSDTAVSCRLFTQHCYRVLTAKTVPFRVTLLSTEAFAVSLSHEVKTFHSGDQQEGRRVKLSATL